MVKKLWSKRFLILKIFCYALGYAILTKLFVDFLADCPYTLEDLVFEVARKLFNTFFIWYNNVLWDPSEQVLYFFALISCLTDPAYWDQFITTDPLKRFQNFAALNFDFLEPSLINLCLFESYFTAYVLEYKVFNFTETLFDFKCNFFVYSFIFYVVCCISSLLLISYLGLYGVFVVNSLGLFVFWSATLFIYSHFLLENFIFIFSLGKWFELFAGWSVYFEVYIDSLSINYMILVLTIAFFVNLYTFSYFRYEPNVERLILLINLFVISMLILVSAGNFINFFLGWELIGATSFFLISFWSTRVGSVKAAFKAFVFNKISDVCILLSVLLIAHLNLDLNIASFNANLLLYLNTDINFLNTNMSLLELIAFFLSIAAFCKSAQFGFHIWLPDSMEAPVPASSLIHSATLVSAGIFLILRFNPLFEICQNIKYMILVVGSFTAFFGGLCAVFQTDVKRLLAYSTISHCGFLMVLTCLNNYDLVIVYLFIHGFFKAAIFMCIGNVIRFSANYQDMRRMGGFNKYLPFECFTSIICLANLSGLPFTLGFYMKHFLLLNIFKNSFVFYLILFMLVSASICGLIYSYRLIYYIFFDFKKARKSVYFKLANRLLKSRYYTNTSLASNISISGLIFFSYFFCGILVFKFLNDYSINMDFSAIYYNFDVYKSYSNYYYNKFYFLINWFIFIIILFIVFNPWRASYKSYKTIENLYLFITFSIFFYFFYQILSY